MERRSLLTIGLVSTAALAASGAYYKLLGQSATKGLAEDGSYWGIPVGQAPYEVAMTEEEWQEKLTRNQFLILRKHRTERAFTSPLDKNYSEGMYHCQGCDLPLYSSKTKFNSGTGWPSFWEAEPDAVRVSLDRSFGMTRVEVHCRRCGGHLGHIFNDGPEPTGLRHCINGVALKFLEA